MTEDAASASQRLQVFIRVRPKNAAEAADAAFEPIFSELADDHVTLVEGRRYRCDGLLDPSDQASVFERVGQPALAIAREGYAAGIMVYGQTGTGKTWTMCNDEDSGAPGITPRIAHALFAEDAGDAKAQVVTLQVVQIYRDQLQDMLHDFEPPQQGAAARAEPSAPDLKDEWRSTGSTQHSGTASAPTVDLRHDDKRGVELLNTRKLLVRDAAHFMAAFRHAMAARVTCSTKMNAASSRSHIAVIVQVRSVREERAGDRTELRGKLVLVDLAGYERFSHTDITEEKHKDEARSINASLLALGNVIQALSSNAAHVPWRNSKLTRLMQDCVGGRSQTVVVLTVGPSAAHEHSTIGTLFFGARAMNVAISSQQDATVDFKRRAMLLQSQLDTAHGRIVELEGERTTLEQQMAATEMQLQSEIELLQRNQLEQLAEMIQRGDAPERLQGALRGFATELSTVLEQQQEERAIADEAALQAHAVVTQNESFARANTSFFMLDHQSDAGDAVLSVPEADDDGAEGDGRRGGGGHADAFPIVVRLRAEMETLRAAATAAERAQRVTADELEALQLELAIEKGISRDLRQKLAAAERTSQPHQTHSEAPALGPDDSINVPFASSPPPFNISPSPAAPRSSASRRRSSISECLTREESLSALVQRIQDEKARKRVVELTPQRLLLDAPTPSPGPACVLTPGVAAPGSRGSRGSVPRLRPVAIDRLQHAQVLRRHMIELEEARAAAKLFCAFANGWSARLAPLLLRSLADIQRRIDGVPQVLVRHEHLFEELLEEKMEALRQMVCAIEGMTRASEADGRAASSPTSRHRIASQLQSSRPESHRLILLSGRSVEGERRRLAGDPMPMVRSDAVQRESLSWKPTELRDFRRMLAFNIYLLGDPDSGKSTLLHCLTNRPPKWIKKPPNVVTPTLGLTRVMHHVGSIKLPTSEAPVGGCPGEILDFAGMMKDSNEVTSCYVRLSEVPLPYLRASKPSGLPYRGAAYFLLYDLRDYVAARARLEAYLRHVVSVCARVSFAHFASAEAGENDFGDDANSGVTPPRFVLPFVLVGTHRDAVPALNVSDDESAVLAVLREQREWFGMAAKELGACSSGRGPQPVLLDSFAVSCAAWTVVGERPRSARGFEELLTETLGFLTLHSPVAPEHLLPAPPPEPHAAKRTISLERFWSAHLNSLATPREERGGGTGLQQHQHHHDRLIARWHETAASGAVTLFTALSRYAESAGCVIDSQTLDNLIIQHFQLTTRNSAPEFGSPAAAAASGTSISGEASSAEFTGSVSQAFRAEPSQDELVAYRDRLIEHFLAECAARGILFKLKTAEGFAVYVLGTTWFDDILTPLLLPALIHHAAIGPGGASSNNGIRHISSLISRAKQIGFNLEYGSLPAELRFHSLGLPSLRYLQSTLRPPVDSIAASHETVMMALQPLNLTCPANTGIDARRRLLLLGSGRGGNHGGKIDFFVPSVAKAAPHALFNFVALAIHATAKRVVNGVANVTAAPLSFLAHVTLGLASIPAVDDMFTWCNGVCFAVGKSVWVLVCSNESSDSRFHVCAGSPFPANAVPIEDVFGEVRRAFEDAAARFPTVNCSFSTTVLEQPPVPFDVVEANARKLLEELATPGVVAGRVRQLQRCIEHTGTPSLPQLIVDLEASA